MCTSAPPCISHQATDTAKAIDFVGAKPTRAPARASISSWTVGSCAPAGANRAARPARCCSGGCNLSSR